MATSSRARLFRTLNVRTGERLEYANYGVYAWLHAPGAGLLWARWKGRR